eukprot:TRINITY_DN15089_c0_g1_i1.p1 TRINITY_DN15089_c0_g1~~TRINITY_DN15089_c0_g1_i1.p1  ORF type:complete len:362 (+),score=112.73 TRINITY_DN15089_c0_g1_i1:52-1086(+)
MAMPPPPPPPLTVGQKVMITGANGYIASHIVLKLLRAGYTVHACVRDAANADSVAHLLALPGAEDRLRLFSTGDLAEPEGKFDEAMEGVYGVVHSATPLRPKLEGQSGEDTILKPTLASTEEMLRCLERHAASVKCFVLTSSMSAMAPRPEPSLKDESHWSDADEQRSRENWYGCAKTMQERMAESWAAAVKERSVFGPDFRYVSVCPTMVIGRVLRSGSEVGGTMGALKKWFSGARTQAPNDSMSFVHVDDCAAMHVAALNTSDISGRYMAVIDSWHWNDILAVMKRVHPALPDYTPYTGDEVVTPTRFNTARMERLQLNVATHTMEEALQDARDYLVSVGAL